MKRVIPKNDVSVSIKTKYYIPLLVYLTTLMEFKDDNDEFKAIYHIPLNEALQVPNILIPRLAPAYALSILRCYKKKEHNIQHYSVEISLSS